MKVAVARHAQRTVPQAASARCRFPRTKRCRIAKAAYRHTGDRSPAPRGSNRGWCRANAKPRSCILDRSRSCLRGLTFELSGRRRQDARPGPVKMYRVPPARAWWPAVGAPLERGVRPHPAKAFGRWHWIEPTRLRQTAGRRLSSRVSFARAPHWLHRQ